MADKMTVAMDALGESFDNQGRLNEAFGRHVTESIEAAGALDARIVAIEGGFALPVADLIADLAGVVAGLEARISTLENDHRLILP